MQAFCSQIPCCGNHQHKTIPNHHTDKHDYMTFFMGFLNRNPHG
jgi:hypothetical protein